MITGKLHCLSGKAKLFGMRLLKKVNLNNFVASTTNVFKVHSARGMLAANETARTKRLTMKRLGRASNLREKEI